VIQRPVELLALLALVTLVAVLLLGRHPGSLRRQAVVGASIGVASAFAVATQQADLIPDQLELPLAIASVVTAVVVILGLHVRFRRRSPV
jgi:hypothetical protein